MSITIIDYGMGNLGSVLNMMKKVGAQAVISSDPVDILSAEKLIFQISIFFPRFNRMKYWNT